MLPEAFAEEHPATRIDQPAQFGQRLDGGLPRAGLAERMAGADAQDQVGRAEVDAGAEAGHPRRLVVVAL